jgi:PKD repeat protein
MAFGRIYHYRSTAVISLMLFFSKITAAQSICNPQGNLFIISNYDGGRVTINVDVDIPDLKIGICTYEPVQVTISGPFAANVTRVIYAGFNSNQNNNNCSLGNFSTSITGVSASIRSIFTAPPVGYSNPNGFGYPLVICGVGNCNPAQQTGGCNTADQIVYYFQQATGGTLYAHQTQYACWINSTINISNAGNCCVTPLVAIAANFSASATETCAGNCIQFTNTSIGAPFTSVNWTFTGGNPATSNQINPEVCYSTPGNYAVTITVTNSIGNATLFRNSYIKVNPPLVPPPIQHRD